MLIRALIVLLVALNLGTAAWWLSRPAAVAAPARPVPEAEPGVPQLALWQQAAPADVAAAPTLVAAPVPSPAPAAPALAPAVEPAAAAPAPALQCLALGPFADEAAARAAQARVGTQIRRASLRSQPGRSASGYSVSLPPAASREQAQATAQKIAAAGFDDYLIVNSGEQANAIALGRYRSREGAQRRQAALQAAGFPAQLTALGEEAAPQWWLDVAADADAIADARRSSGAPGQRPLDCAAVR